MQLQTSLVPLVLGLLTMRGSAVISQCSTGQVRHCRAELPQQQAGITYIQRAAYCTQLAQTRELQAWKLGMKPLHRHCLCGTLLHAAAIWQLTFKGIPAL